MDTAFSHPAARRDAEVRFYGHEAVAWSDTYHEPVVLDPVEALIFGFLDGSVPKDELIRDVTDVVKIPASAATTRVDEMVAKFSNAGLLTSSPERQHPPVRDLFPGPPNP